jgi:fluoride exporter
MFTNCLLIGVGGAIGSIARYYCSVIIPNKQFPLSTLVVNIVGSFIIGIVIGLTIKNNAYSNHFKLFFATGLCGGFTTFSTFSLENLQLLQEGKFVSFGIYLFTSIILGIGCTLIGFKLIN